MPARIGLCHQTDIKCIAALKVTMVSKLCRSSFWGEPRECDGKVCRSEFYVITSKRQVVAVNRKYIELVVVNEVRKVDELFGVGWL